MKTRVAIIADLLNRYQVEYVVVGAEACNVHGVVRATKDVDILLKKTKENLTRALDALGNLPYHIAREIDPDMAFGKPVIIIGDDPRVDLLFAAGKLNYTKAYPSMMWMTIEGIRIPFADPEALVLSKQTDRAKDQADLEVLQHIIKTRN